MRGSDIVKHIVRGEMPDTERVLQNCHRQMLLKQGLRRALHARPAFALSAAAAVIACAAALIVLRFGEGAPENLLAMQIFAADRREDCTLVLREVDISDGPRLWGGHVESGVFRLNIALEIDTSDIRHIRLATDGLIVAGSEIVGADFVFENGAAEDGLWLSLALPIDGNQVAGEISLHIAAVFIDGAVHEGSLVFEVDASSVPPPPIIPMSDELRDFFLHEFGIDMDALELFELVPIGEPISLMDDPEIYALIQAGARREEITDILRRRALAGEGCGGE